MQNVQRAERSDGPPSSTAYIGSSSFKLKSRRCPLYGSDRVSADAYGSDVHLNSGVCLMCAVRTRSPFSIPVLTLDLCNLAFS